jgi:hypothetical protein
MLSPLGAIRYANELQQSLHRFSVVLSLDEVETIEEKARTSSSSKPHYSLYDEDISFKDWVPQTKWLLMPTIYKGSKVSYICSEQ